jgi:hypothetical protein
VLSPEELADHQANMARLTAIHALPVEPYVGLTIEEAQALAAQEGREVRVITSLTGPRRADLRKNRLNVVLDADGRVTGADAG